MDMRENTKTINLQEAQRRLGLLLEAYDALFYENTINKSDPKIEFKHIKMDPVIIEMKMNFDNYMFTQLLKRSP